MKCNCFKNHSVSGDDYEPLTQTLTVSPGASTLSISLTSIEDNILEVVQNLTVTLANPTSGLFLGLRRMAVVNIVDRDGEQS